MVLDRRTLKEYVLGPDRPTSMERFNSATNALAAKGEAEQAEATTEAQQTVSATALQQPASADVTATTPGRLSTTG